MRAIMMMAATAMLMSVAHASTPESWAGMNRRVNRACVAMSGLARPELLAKRISFSDTIGTEIRMIRGLDRRGRMQRILCAYNRRTGRAEIQPADVWNGPTTRP